jgi:hypothetical protein
LSVFIIIFIYLLIVLDLRVRISVYPYYQTRAEIGGPLSDAETEKFNGSLFVVEAESVAAVREVLEKDPYWINDVVRAPSPFPPPFLSLA